MTHGASTTEPTGANVGDSNAEPEAGPEVPRADPIDVDEMCVDEDKYDEATP
jgi:hypothetical protein